MKRNFVLDMVGQSLTEMTKIFWSRRKRKADDELWEEQERRVWEYSENILEYSRIF